MNAENNMSAKKFSNRKAAEAILKIMRQLGLKTRKHCVWIKHDKGESVIRISNYDLVNTDHGIQVSVTEHGVSFRNSHAVFADWSHRNKSFRRFNQHMGHVLFHYG